MKLIGASTHSASQHIIASINWFYLASYSTRLLGENKYQHKSEINFVPTTPIGVRDLFLEIDNLSHKDPYP